jgi:ATP-dependent DNA helicase PIF1
MAKKKIIITKEFKEAFKVMEEGGEHVFLTGRAGTGKSTLLKYFRKKTKKKHVVLAPTGVAALNVKGQTIHSFFGFHPRIEKSLVRKAFEDNLPMFKNLEMIIIDEISMVRADLLDCVDRALRLNRNKPKVPFGGVQMVFIGDLYQLPPVVTRDEQHRFEVEYPSPYFFHSDVLRPEHVEVIELQKVHRQKEASFVALLNNLRLGQVPHEDVQVWNERHDPFYNPEEESEHVVHLCTTNKMADGRNQYELKKLDGQEWKLKARKQGDLGDRRMPSEPVVKLKEGARVMFTTNDPERRFVNGSLGTVRKIRKKGLSKLPIIEVELDDTGDVIEVGQHTWEVFEYAMGKKGRFEEQVVGSYTQYPIMLAWAVTIHKAQGKTFDKVLVDVGWGAFAHGQLYVALSRCTKFKGITLLKPFKQKDVIIDEAVLKFMGEQ